MKVIFIITGVCRSGEIINVDLARFLEHESHKLVFWIDFKCASDFEKSRAHLDSEVPSATLQYAPPAVWAGASIVNSMLSAVSYCANRISEWTHIVFCSMHDVPLVRQEELLSTLYGMIRDCDYVGSRWNTNPIDLIAPLENAPFVDNVLSERTYERFTIRGGMVIRRESALSAEFPAQNIRSLRLCTDLRERYLVGVSENVALGQLSIHRMTAGRVRERWSCFSRLGLYAGRQWCVLSRRFCDLLLSDYVDDLFRDWFSDVLIPDECFFQTMANFLLVRAGINVQWQSLYLADAQNMLIWPDQIRGLQSARASNELFARKSATRTNFATVLEG